MKAIIPIPVKQACSLVLLLKDKIKECWKTGNKSAYSQIPSIDETGDSS